MGNVLTHGQLLSELDRCLFCEEKPCMDACPVNCSPADFIEAIRVGKDSDYKRASSIILSKNILGGICGSVCPDYHCMAACSRVNFDNPIKIPEIQSTIIKKGKELGFKAQFTTKKDINKRVGIIGGGPAGIACANILAHEGCKVDIFESDKELGGMCNYIPESRLHRDTLSSDIDNAINHDNIRVYNNTAIYDIDKFKSIYDAVVIASGQDEAIKLNIHGKDYAHDWKSFLSANDIEENSRVAIIGGGAVAIDCALKSKALNAEYIDFYMLEMLSEMNLSRDEKAEFFNNKFGIYFRTSVKEIEKDLDGLKLHCQRVMMDSEEFRLDKIERIANSDFHSMFYDYVVFAVGSKTSIIKKDDDKLFYCGDMKNNATTVVEAVADGRNCAINVLNCFNPNYINLDTSIKCKSYYELNDSTTDEISLESDFFGRKIDSPYLLSAAPPSDGYEQVAKAYKAGWSGAVMKTAFDDLDIHIPHDYMFKLNDDTYANCDNVSEIPLKQVLADAKKLIEEFPEKLTIVSTGGPVTGNDSEDKLVWQSNTKMIEAIGVGGVEYSLSCPQGGDGTEGDIVSQNPALTAKVVDWILEVSAPNIPKLFKLTGAVTSINPILKAIKAVLNKYPEKKAGVTLANSFPAVDFRQDVKKEWDDGVMIGMSGDAVKYISNLTLAKASSEKMIISGNGGVMTYLDAANFLALGCQTVQICTAVMKKGFDYIGDLKQGLKYLMLEKGIKDIDELIGKALPKPIQDFMDISPIKRISDVDPDLCQHCGNCTRCPYLAISLDDNKIPVTDATRCIGCSICVQKCFSKALFMRERTKEEWRD